eukprot:7381053-Prymnesium_polylepis.1
MGKSIEFRSLLSSPGRATMETPSSGIAACFSAGSAACFCADSAALVVVGVDLHVKLPTCNAWSPTFRAHRHRPPQQMSQACPNVEVWTVVASSGARYRLEVRPPVRRQPFGLELDEARPPQHSCAALGWKLRHQPKGRWRAASSAARDAWRWEFAVAPALSDEPRTHLAAVARAFWRV